MRHPNRPVTKTMILEHIFDYSFDPQTNVVDVLVHRLRSKVDKRSADGPASQRTRGKVDKDTAMIHTIRGVGYVLRPA
jgi:two-component system OmpR family response regulator